jgi:hypothetical protein
MRLLDRLLHEPYHEHVTAHINILTEIKTRSRCPKTQLNRLRAFSRHGTPYRPTATEIEPHRSIAVRLEPIRRVKEGGGIRNLARNKATREVVDTVRHGVPYALLLIFRGVWRRGDLVAFYNERI